jgi:hypothetical protein
LVLGGISNRSAERRKKESTQRKSKATNKEQELDGAVAKTWTKATQKRCKPQEKKTTEQTRREQKREDQER